MSMAAAIAILRDAYPRQDFPDRSVVLYAHELADLSDTEVTAAVRRLIRRSEWLPSIAEIRREVAEERAGLPTVEEAWTVVSNEKRTFVLPPEVAGALSDIGGSYALRTMTAHQARTAFAKAYEARRESTLLVVMKALPARPEIEDVTPARLALPETTRIRPRPVMARLSRRWAGRDVPATPPTDEEMADAILVLRSGPEGDLDPLYEEAQRILDDADRHVAERLALSTPVG